MFQKIKKLLSSHETQYYGYPQTFTYFIPAPPSRKLGYREKAFDGIVKEISKNGFDITDIKTQSIGHKSTAGMWVILTLRATCKEALTFDLSSVQQEMDSIIAATNDAPLKGHNINDDDDNQGEKCIELPLSTNDDEDNGDTLEGIYYID